MNWSSHQDKHQNDLLIIFGTNQQLKKLANIREFVILLGLYICAFDTVNNSVVLMDKNQSLSQQTVKLERRARSATVQIAKVFANRAVINLLQSAAIFPL